MGCSTSKDARLLDPTEANKYAVKNGILKPRPEYLHGKSDCYPIDLCENVDGSVEHLATVYATRNVVNTFKCMRTGTKVRKEKQGISGDVSRSTDRLAHLELTQGQFHPDTIAAAENLAKLLQDSGKFHEAEPLWRRVVSARVEADGYTHPHTLKALSNLAALLVRLDKRDEAEKIYRNNLKHRETISGPKHPCTLECMENLALLLEKMGKLAESEQLLRRALEGKTSTLGPFNIETLTSMNNLAKLLKTAGKPREAESLLRCALENNKATVEDHDHMLILFNTFATVLSMLGKQDEVEFFYRRAWKRNETALGSTHLKTMASLDNLVGLLQVRGRHHEAEQLLRRSSEERRAAFGPSNSHTLASLSNLAALLAGMGRYNEAEQLYRSITESKEATLGATHPETLSSLDELVGLLQTMGHSTEAKRHTQELGAFPSLRRVCPEPPPNSARTTMNSTRSPREHSARGLCGNGEIRYATTRRKPIQPLDLCSPRKGHSNPSSARGTNAFVDSYPLRKKLELSPRDTNGLRHEVYTIDVDKPLGILFDDALCVDAVYEGSQAAELGVKIGWRACLVNSERVYSVPQYMTLMQALRSQRGMKVDVLFEAPKQEVPKQFAPRSDVRNGRQNSNRSASSSASPRPSCGYVNPRCAPKDNGSRQNSARSNGSRPNSSRSNIVLEMDYINDGPTSGHANPRNATKDNGSRQNPRANANKANSSRSNIALEIDYVNDGDPLDDKDDILDWSFTSTRCDLTSIEEEELKRCATLVCHRESTAGPNDTGVSNKCN